MNHVESVAEQAMQERCCSLSFSSHPGLRGLQAPLSEDGTRYGRISLRQKRLHRLDSPKASQVRELSMIKHLCLWTPSWGWGFLNQAGMHTRTTRDIPQRRLCETTTDSASLTANSQLQGPDDPDGPDGDGEGVFGASLGS